jgi:hypothetical protein
MNNFHEKKRTCFALSTLPSLEEGHASYYQSPSVHPGGTALWGEVHRCLTLCYDSACSLAETSHLFHSQTETTKQTTLRNMLDSDGSVHLETNGQTFTYLGKKRACLVLPTNFRVDLSHTSRPVQRRWRVFVFFFSLCSPLLS